MLLHTADMNLIPVLGDVLENRLFRIQAPAKLIEIHRFNARTLSDGAGRGLKTSRKQIEKRRLAASVAAD